MGNGIGDKEEISDQYSEHEKEVEAIYPQSAQIDSRRKDGDVEQGAGPEGECPPRNLRHDISATGDMGDH